jgi:hypothetical protein
MKGTVNMSLKKNLSTRVEATMVVRGTISPPLCYSL